MGENRFRVNQRWLLTQVRDRLEPVAPSGVVVQCQDTALYVGSAVEGWAMFGLRDGVVGSAEVVGEVLRDWLQYLLDDTQTRFAELTAEPWPRTGPQPIRGKEPLPRPRVEYRDGALHSWFGAENGASPVLALAPLPLSDVCDIVADPGHS